ncbi:MAG: beta-ketoacyl-[acyl-carrier-protein] synthase family protein [Candidatus Omnitrophota bacterium]
MKKRVVITGVGAIASNSIGIDEFWDALKAGKSGIKKITSFDTKQFPTKVAGEITDFNPEKFLDLKQARRMDRFVQFAVSVAKMAVKDSGLNIKEEDSKRIGVITGTATAGQGWVFTQYEIFRSKGYKRLNPFTAASTFPNASSSQISLEFKINGPSETFSTGCASGGIAMGHALELIRNNKIDIAIVVGSEALLYAPIFGTYCVARIMSTKDGSIIKTPAPFDKNRDGMVLAEGAGCIILESLDHAKKRKAQMYAEFIGWGETCDAYHIISTEPHGKEAERAILMAIEDSGIKLDDINYVKMHGIGDSVNDKIETQVMKRVFGKKAYDIPMTSIKSMIGHTQGACSVLETVSTVLAMKNSMIPPTINYETPDPECDLDYVPNNARSYKISCALINTFGFGGKNVSLIIKKI